MAGLDLVSAAAQEPLTLDEAKAHLNVDVADFDDLIDAYIAAARSSVEAVLKMSLMETAWKYRLDGGFPREIRLPIGPVFDGGASPNDLTITYVDDAGAAQTLATTGYQVSYGTTAVIRPAYGMTWPATRPIMDAVAVNFQAGWKDRADIPKAMLQALRLTVGDCFAHRENTVIGTITAELPISARNLLMPFVRWD